MFRWKTLFTLVLTLAVILTAVSSALAQDVTPKHTDPGWQAMYWNNTSLSGSPIVQRFDPDLNFDWAYGSPDAALPADQFSARWTRYVDVTPGNYRFTVTSDDGMRLWVDNTLLIDFWGDHSAQSRTADIYLGSGHHLVQVEYYENGGAALAKVDYQLANQPPPPTPTPVPPPTGGWSADYFNNTTLSGYPMISQIDANIDFNWGLNSPNFRFLPADYFSVRWTRSMNLPAGNYRFTMTADDGARLFVNGHTLIDAWRVQPERDYTGDIYLPGGVVTVIMEYFDQTEVATARLRWQLLQPGGDDGGNAGTVIVDDSDPGFTKGGLPRGWATEYEGYNNNLTWTQNNDWARPQYNWGRWYPQLQAGRYEVFVYIPDRFSTTSNAVYWISHQGGFSKRAVNQNNYSNQWVSLGTYTFRGSGQDYLSLADVTGERYLSRLVVWDAVKWEPR